LVRYDFIPVTTFGALTASLISVAGYLPIAPAAQAFGTIAVSAQILRQPSVNTPSRRRNILLVRGQRWVYVYKK